ncbi:aromatic ring-hydroxylating oxygenase subunit alpha [Atopomonas hussainii]|uniref:aromatic ring-hydroxylating oxygenase subunit alpha n=1 Tax=Atopomonas hussainii TaxID=1429083 RepID=UPI0009002B19|nr:aromatic ring-hydroxylating dioxygenase subunit alpha [Atopomonas hussainii]
MSQPQQALPREAYLSAEWYAAEQQYLFGHSWQYLGPADEMPAAGHYRCVQLGSYPMLLLRDQDGTLRLLHNLCRHRGMPLLEGSGALPQHLRCPYHSWTYQQDGSLRALPQAERFPCLNKAEMGLKRGALDEWQGLMFGHTQPDAEPLAQWFAGLEDTLAPHDLSACEEQPVEVHTLKANWKVFVENYMDGYHLRHLHSVSLGKHYDHDAIAQGQLGPHWYFYQPLTAEGHKTALSSSSYPLIPGQDPKHLGAYVHLLFPNLGITASEESWSLLHIEPLDALTTRVTIRSWAMPVSTLRYLMLREPKSPDSADHPVKTGDLMGEDIAVCEAIQRSMHSPAYQVGALAEELEAPLAHFQQAILSYLKASQ